MPQYQTAADRRSNSGPPLRWLPVSPRFVHERGMYMTNEQNDIVNELPTIEVQPPRKEAVRDEGGKFVKGHSGNPLGKPKGTKNRGTLLREQIDDALMNELVDDNEFVKVLHAVLRKAKEGDMQAAKLILKDIIQRAAPDQKGSGGKTVNVVIENFTVQGEKDASSVIEGVSEVLDPQR